MTVLLTACFLVTGAAGLAYEILWSRHLALLFGVNAEAVGLVLAVFMSGLGLGSRAFGALADRARVPLRLFAGLEAGIGLFALATGPLLVAVSRAFPALAAAFGGGPAAAAAAKALLAAAVLFPPAFFMGGTFPALARAVAGGGPRAPRVVPLLYAVNLAGAVLGAAATGFWLVEAAGLSATMRIAAAADLGVAAVVLWVSRRGGTASPEPVPAAAGPEPLGPFARAALFTGLFVSGAVFMLYEVVFTRLLSLAFGVSSYSFTLVLVVCLLGLGIGGVAASARAARGPVGLATFGRVQLVSVALLVLAMAAVPLVSRTLVLARQVPGLGFGPTLVLKAALTVVFLLPLSAVAGAGMPLLLSFVAGRPGGVGTSVGRAVLVNTAGTVVGSLATGFALVTAFGSQATLRLGGLASLGAGVAALATARGRPVAAAASAAVLALGILAVPRWPDWVFLRSDTLPGLRPATTRLELEQRLRVSNLERLFFEEGRNATVAVLQGTRSRSLVANGHAEASDVGDMATQLGVAIVPLVLHPDPRDVLVVGFASGATAGAAARAPGVGRVDVAELEAAMFRAAVHFAHVNSGVLESPKVRLHPVDARSLIAAGGTRWDVVISEPSNLWRAGVSNLFTADFYASARRALKPGGVFAQWLQLYGLRWETLRTIFATLVRSFPHAEIWWLDGGDVVLLGSESPLVASRARAEAILSGTYGEDLRNHLAMPEPSAFWARYLLGRPDLEALVEGAERINTDDRPAVEFDAPRDLFLPDENNAGRLLEEKISRGRFAPPVDGTPPTRGESWAGLAGMYGVAGRPALARAAALRAFDESRDPALVLRAARFALQDGALADAEADLAVARAAAADAAEAADVEGRLRRMQGRLEEAVAAFGRANTSGAAGLERLSLLAALGGEDAALEQADRLLAARAAGALSGGDAARVVGELARAARSPEGAVRSLSSIERWIGRDPGVPRIPVLKARAALELGAGRPAEALRACGAAAALSALDLDLMSTRAGALRALGRHAEAARVERERAPWAGEPTPR